MGSLNKVLLIGNLILSRKLCKFFLFLKNGKSAVLKTKRIYTIYFTLS